MTVVAFLSDFGLEDHYAAAMKAEVLRRAPHAVLVDITHLIPPQNIARGAYELSCVLPSFPDETIVVGVVDPGVGTDRRPLALRLRRGIRLIGPDNGLFSRAVLEDGGQLVQGQVTLGAGQAGYVLDASRIASRLSATFHGRDLFAPAAGLLAAGTPLERLGTPTTAILALPILEGDRVLAVDRFGNVITSVRPEPNVEYEVVIGDQRIVGLRRTYAEGQGLLLLTSSSGYLEIAVPGASAAALLGLGPGDRITVIRREKARD
ncbi:MAG: SAM-dependent chlorinase/fluorinase [Chloroflexota bacterium]|nr:SAM-dependent chlorinase/fluorinase [Dehalococcoidia bacterium]MDW8253992.1 SAM-dependent chlorinase/fluorinase [Chloroflexota bacterium]